MALEWHELDGSPIEEWNEETGSFRAVQTFKTVWADRLAVANVFLRDGGLPYSNATGFTGLVARSAAIKPFLQSRQEGSSAGVARYVSAEIAITYSTPNAETPVIINNVLTTQNIQPNAEFFTLDHTPFRWGDTSGTELNPNESPGQLNVGFDYILTQQGLTAVPLHVLSYPGTVNNGVVTADLLGISFAQETLLYNPPTVSAGTQLSTWNVSYRFSYRRTGWNRFWRSETQEYERIYHTETGEYKSYPAVDFTII